MSAWIVSNRHIDALITAGLKSQHGMNWRYAGKNQSLSEENATEVGKMLLAENFRSVNYRYGEDRKVRRYKYKPLEKTAVEILKNISCLEYQSCECDDWEQSEAYKFLQTLRDCVIGQLPGYAEAAWGIDG